MRIGLSLDCLGQLARAEGNDDQARECFEKAFGIARAIGARWLIGQVLADQGWLARSEGNREGARARTHEVLRLLRNTGDEDAIDSGLLLAGVLAADDAAVRRGTSLLAHVDARGALPLTVLPVLEDRKVRDRCISTARAKLGDDDFARAWAEGKAMTREQAIALVLDAL